MLLKNYMVNFIIILKRQKFCKRTSVFQAVISLSADNISMILTLEERSKT